MGVVEFHGARSSTIAIIGSFPIKFSRCSLRKACIPAPGQYVDIVLCEISREQIKGMLQYTVGQGIPS